VYTMLDKGKIVCTLVSMVVYTVREARGRMKDMLDKVKRGEEVCIGRRGEYYVITMSMREEEGDNGCRLQVGKSLR
jgi:prevent-host-death family protein